MKNLTTQVQKGFTLIELMIVVAIIGILASIAVPAYQDYITKSKFQDIISAAAAVEMAVSLCMQEQNGVAANCDTIGEVGIGNLQDSKYAATALAIAGTTAAVTATATAEAGGYTYINTPTLSGGDTQVIWTQSGTCEAALFCKE